ncbi:MAG: FHA domain-containing protein [Polyangiaceae bacterium]|nr:FHA domain-containing protein [Polyangiaceae bacterium]
MSTGDPTSVRLKYRQVDVYLSEGDYLVGRSASCQIVLDRPRVSRRHARLSIRQERMSIEDLKSANGVYVNGERITAPRELASGDRLLVGDEPLEIYKDPALAGPELATSTQREGSTSIPPAPAAMDWDGVTGGVGTQKADAFELVGRLADRCFADGKPEEAENVLRAHLSKVLEQSRRHAAVSERARQAALSYALELALNLESPRWIDYALDLLSAQQMLLSEALGRELSGAVSRIHGVDQRRVSSYLELLRTLPNSVERSRAIERAEALLRVLRR